MLTRKIYRKDAKGGIRVWQAEVEGDKWRTMHGIAGGKMAVSEWTVCKPKSRKTAAEQATFEAEAELAKKLKREYRMTVPELDDVPVSPMLAQDFTKQKKLEFPLYSQPKLDGIRSLHFKHGPFSREYQPHHNVHHIHVQLARFFEQYPNAQLDGELYNHDLRDDFNEISSVVRTQKVTDEDRIKAEFLIQYHVYDVVLPDNPDFTYRNAFLQTMFADGGPLQGLQSVKLVPTELCLGQEALDLCRDCYLEHGYEGQMVRVNGPYDGDKRSKLLLKRKEWQDAEFPWLRTEEGEGNWSGCGKRIVYQMPDGAEGVAAPRGNREFTRKLLSTELTPESLVTIRFFGITPDGAHRFPTATDFHPLGRVD